MAGASACHRAQRPQEIPPPVPGGPRLHEMFGILLNHIAKEKPGAKVAFVYLTRVRPRPDRLQRSPGQEMGLSVAVKIMTPAGSVDVSTEVIKLRRAAPDYTIFHGYIPAPIPEFITQGKQQGMKSKWMGTF